MAKVESVYNNNLGAHTHIHISTDRGVLGLQGLRSVGCFGCPVLTTRVEQRQRFRQRERLKERSAVADAVQNAIYRAQWTECRSHINYRLCRTISAYSQLHEILHVMGFLLKYTVFIHTRTSTRATQYSRCIIVIIENVKKVLIYNWATRWL